MGHRVVVASPALDAQAPANVGFVAAFEWAHALMIEVENAVFEGFQPGRVIKDWMNFCNDEGLHTALDQLTPDGANWAGLEKQKAA